MIPNYLKKYAKDISNKKNHYRFNIFCTCGCEEFYIYVKKKTKEEIIYEKECEKNLIKEYGKNHEILSDKNGSVFLVKRNIFGKIVKKDSIENFNFPDFKNLIAIKCKNCGNIITIFDETIHGYNATINIIHKKNNLISFNNLKFSDNVYNLEVNVYYEEKELNKAVPDPSIAFDRIKIIGISNKKKKTIGDYECS